MTSFFSSLWDLLLSLLLWIPRVIFEGIKLVIDGIMFFLELTIMPLIDEVLSFAGFDIQSGFTADFLAQLNFFFPVAELFSVLLVLFIFWVQVLTLKIVLKLFPTIY